MVSYVKKSQSTGFTLIELMLATSLLMIVMFSGYYAYSLYSQKWQKRVQVFWYNTEQATALDSLHKIVSSAIPYIVNAENGNPRMYFKGTSSSMSLISNSAIFTDSPALIHLQLESIPNSDNHNLIYREQSVKSNLILDISQQGVWQHEIILLSNITDFNLSYFGWQSLADAISNDNDESINKEDGRVWYQTHNSDVSRLLPEQLQITFTSKKGMSNFQLALPQHSLYRLLTYLREDI